MCTVYSTFNYKNFLSLILYFYFLIYQQHLQLNVTSYISVIIWQIVRNEAKVLNIVIFSLIKIIFKIGISLL